MLIAHTHMERIIFLDGTMFTEIKSNFGISQVIRAGTDTSWRLRVSVDNEMRVGCPFATQKSEYNYKLNFSPTTASRRF